MDILTVTGIARVVVYVKALSRCVQCDATKRRLDELHVPYDTVAIDLPEHADLLEAFKARGYGSAPVVVLLNADGTERDLWAGYRPDLADEHLKAAA